MKIRCRAAVPRGAAPVNGPSISTLRTAGLPSIISSVLAPKVASIRGGCSTPSATAGRFTNDTPTTRWPAVTGTRATRLSSAWCEYVSQARSPRVLPV